MIIIGCDYHPGFQQIAFVDTDTGEFQERRWSTGRKRKSLIATWECKARWCAWAWKRVGTLAGLNDCWGS